MEIIKVVFYQNGTYKMFFGENDTKGLRIKAKEAVWYIKILGLNYCTIGVDKEKIFTLPS